MVKRTTAKTAQHEKNSQQNKSQYRFCVAFAIINAIYLIVCLTINRSPWVAGWVHLWPFAIYVVLNIIMIVYVLVQPKLQKVYLDVAMFIGFMLLFLYGLLCILGYQSFNSSSMVMTVSALMMLNGLIFIFARVRHQVIPQKLRLALIIGATLVTSIAYVWAYSTYWSRSLYDGFPDPDAYYIKALLIVGISGLIWVVRLVSWTLALSVLSDGLADIEDNKRNS